MKKFTFYDGAALVIWLSPVVYLIAIYSSLPASVPVHYNINGSIDRYGSKSEFVTTQLITMSVGLLVYLLLKYLPFIDPKKQVKFGIATFQKLALGIIVFLSALNLVIIFTSTHHGFKVEKLILPLIGLFFAFMGNMMNNIKPNYFAGIRTPWTLESEDNWRATHRLAGKVWFFGGIAITILVFLVPPEAGTIIFTCSILIMAFLPVIYSYIYFKKHQITKS